MRGRRRGIVIGGVVAVAAVIIAAGLWVTSTRAPPATEHPPTFSVAFADETGSLGPLFHPGVILGVAANSSSSLIAGIQDYNRSTGFELPVIAGTQPPEGTSGAWADLTPAFNVQYWDGGVYSAAWNGTSWLLGGQASWGGIDTGSAAFLTGGQLDNITPSLQTEFARGGIFAVGWNGTSWLIGGNSSTGIGLAAVTGDRVTDLSSEVPGHVPSGWIQAVKWNGAEWMIMGEGVFGVLRGATYKDLAPGSPFLDNGCFAADFNGTAWLVGGGAGQIEQVVNDVASPGPKMPSDFNQVVLFVVALGNGWIIAGKGSVPHGTTTPAFVTWTGTSTGGMEDLTGTVPGSFVGGEIQAGAIVGSSNGGHTVSLLLVGDGNYNYSTGTGSGAVALATVNYS